MSNRDEGALRQKWSGESGESGYRFVHGVDVRFADIDAMGHAHHSRPLLYFEEARAAYWREIAGRPGVGDIDYLLAEAGVQYHGRIEYPQRLDVHARVASIGRKSFVMEYEARSPAGELLASGRTVQVMYDYDKSASMEMPAELRAKIEAYESGEAGRM